jgi:hypothetical protein
MLDSEWVIFFGSKKGRKIIIRKQTCKPSRPAPKKVFKTSSEADDSGSRRVY